MRYIIYLTCIFVFLTCIRAESAFVEFIRPEEITYTCIDSCDIYANIFSYMDFYGDDSLHRFTDYYYRIRDIDTTDLGVVETTRHHGIDISHANRTQLHAPFDCVLIKKAHQTGLVPDTIEVPIPISLRTFGGDSIKDSVIFVTGLVGYGNYAWYYAPRLDITLLIAHLNSEPSDPELTKYSKGDLIATGGNTGHSSGPHLHFEILSGYQFSATLPAIRRAHRINPEPYYFNETPDLDLKCHFELVETEKQDTINMYSYNISAHDFFDETYRTIEGIDCYKPYTIFEPSPGPGR